MKVFFPEKVNYLFADLDGTLIRTVSGEPFPKDCTDFVIRKDVLDAIRKLPNIDSIGIVSNQGGIPQYMSDMEFRAKLRAIEKFIGVYCHVMVFSDYCTSLKEDNPKRKPNPGMLKHLAFVYPKILFPKDNAMMIGDASGNPGQWSDTDKKTAENFEIAYMDVEDFVEAMKDYVPNTLEAQS